MRLQRAPAVGVKATIVPFTMRWFVTTILFASALFPLLVLKNQIFEWEAGVGELQKFYPAYSHIDIGGRTLWGTSGNFKQRDYLLFPGCKIVRVAKIENRPISINVQSDYGLLHVGASILLVDGLLLFVAIPYVRKHGIFPP